MFNQSSESASKANLRLVLEYRPDQIASFCRLYDNEYFQMQGPWLFPPQMVAKKSAEQLRDLFRLPFLPKFICDAAVAPDNHVLAYATPDSKVPNVYYAEAGVSFSNERLI